MNETIEEINSEEVATEAVAEDITVEEATGGSPTEATETASESTVDYEALEAEDVRAIRSLFPEYKTISSVTELDDPLRYAALRDLGLSVKEAFLATQKRLSRYDNRSHLKSSVPRGAKSDGISMSAEALKEARELFSGLSDTEIQSLYKTVIK